MQTDQNSQRIRPIPSLCRLGAVGGLSDGELLGRFVARQGESAELAFATLVVRHGPMVYGVCRSVLGNNHDAQDAFQATFLVLVQRAGAVRRRESVGSWLYGVALRVATCAKIAAARRRAHEERASRLRVGHSVGLENSTELGAIVHEEVGRLPERYREAVVLCDLEGQTYEAAAQRLGWPVGTVKSRLARGRERLRGRLNRRGLAPTVGVVASALLAEAASTAVAAPLAGSTVWIAMQVVATGYTAGAASAAVTTLTRKVLKGMINTKLRLYAGGLLLLPVVALCAVGFAAQMPERTAPRSLPQTMLGKLIRRMVWREPGSFERVELENNAVRLAIAPDGKTLAASCWGGPVLLLNPLTGENRAMLGRLDRAYMRSIDFAPDGKTIVAGSGDNPLQFWDTGSGTLRRSSPRLGDLKLFDARSIVCTSVAYSPDGQTVAVVNAGIKGNRSAVSTDDLLFELRVLDARTSRTIWSRLDRGEMAFQVAFAPDSKSLALATMSGVKVWDSKTGSLTQTLRPAEGGGRCALAISPNGTTLAGWGTATRQGMRLHVATLWDLRTGAILHTINAGAGAGGGEGVIAFSPDGKTLATGGHPEASVKLWDVATGQLIWISTPGGLGAVSSLVFTPDGLAILCCDHAATRRIDAKTGEVGQKLLLQTKTLRP